MPPSLNPPGGLGSSASLSSAAPPTLVAAIALLLNALICGYQMPSSGVGFMWSKSEGGTPLLFSARASLSSLPLSAKPSFPKVLRRWATRHSSTRECLKHC